jgi:hypothetical protein
LFDTKRVQDSGEHCPVFTCADQGCEWSRKLAMDDHGKGEPIVPDAKNNPWMMGACLQA